MGKKKRKPGEIGGVKIMAERLTTNAEELAARVRYPELYGQFLLERDIWSRHGYPITERAMEGINRILDIKLELDALPEHE